MRIVTAALAALLGLGLFSTGASAQVVRTMPIQRVQMPASAQTQMNSSTNACPANRQSSGLCWGSVRFESDLAASADCAAGGGRIPTLGELVAFRAGPGASETGIECSSNFDMGSGTLWCAGNGGAVSGTTYNPQIDPLEKLPAEFRCVTYLK
jgi:hypothetical protein